MRSVYINSLGVNFPGPPVSNGEMESYLGLIGGRASRNRATILRQNRITSRHYGVDQQGKPITSSAGMAALAIRDAVANSETDLRRISYLATSCTLGDFLVPGLASHVHAALGTTPIEIASFQSVCASSLMALKSAWLNVATSQHECAAVSGSEFASRYFRPGFYEETEYFKQHGRISFAQDFLRFTLSDGAGAAILEGRPNEHQRSLRILWIDIRSYADRFDASMVAGAVMTDERWRYWSEFEGPASAMRAGALVLTQDFDLMRSMLPVWVAHYVDLIEAGKIDIAAVDHVCCHYSSHSLRTEAFALLEKAGALIQEEKWFSNLSTRGNTGAASIFILLEELYRTHPLQIGQKILCHVPESGRALNGFMMLEVV